MAGLPPLVTSIKEGKYYADAKPSDVSDDVAYANGVHLLQWILGVLTTGQQPVSEVTGKFIQKVNVDHLTDEQHAAFLNWFMEGDGDAKITWLGRQWYLYGRGLTDVPLNEASTENFMEIPAFFNWLLQAPSGIVAGKSSPFSFPDGTFKVTGGRRRRATRKRKTT